LIGAARRTLVVCAWLVMHILADAKFVNGAHQSLIHPSTIAANSARAMEIAGKRLGSPSRLRWRLCVHGSKW
jgi:hypothetical protein